MIATFYENVFATFFLNVLLETEFVCGNIKKTCLFIVQVKSKVDELHLDLQNLLYEVMHMKKEIQKCMNFSWVFFYQEAFRQFVINSFTKVVPIILKPVHWFSCKIFFIFIKKRRTYLECVLHPKVKNLLMSLCMNFKVSPHIQEGMNPLSINSTKWSVTLKQFVDIRRLLTILWGWRLKG